MEKVTFILLQTFLLMAMLQPRSYHCSGMKANITPMFISVHSTTMTCGDVTFCNCTANLMVPDDFLKPH